MDFLLSGVANRLLGNRERNIGVARNIEVKDFAPVRSRRTERTNDNGSWDWLRGGEELDGEIFLGLVELASFAAIGTQFVPNRPFPCHFP